MTDSAIDPTGMERALRRHCELYTRGHDDDAHKREWLTLFTDDCYVEEPVGSPRRFGVHSLAWDMGHRPERRIRLEPVLIVASDLVPEAAMVVHIRGSFEGSDTEFDAVGSWEFAGDGRIAGSRIFVSSPRMGPDAWPAAARG
jgi:hypothetical protein